MHHRAELTVPCPRWGDRADARDGTARDEPDQRAPGGAPPTRPALDSRGGGARRGRGGRVVAVGHPARHTDGWIRGAAGRPRPAATPTIFLFDSGTDAIFSNGRFGAPKAIIPAGEGRNALDDTWTEVSWERLAASGPRRDPVRRLPAADLRREGRHPQGPRRDQATPRRRPRPVLNLPSALWTSGPLNIDAAEQLRKALEGWQLAPLGFRPARSTSRPW